MELLATIDLEDYDGLTKISERTACRGIIIKDNKLLMVHSNKGEYKFPGGEVKYGELFKKALIREVNEETGLIVTGGSIKPFGKIVEKRRSRVEEDSIFVHTSYYYLCDVLKSKSAQCLDLDEREKEFTLVAVTAEEALKLNRTAPYNHTLRETKVIELLLEKRLLK